MHIGTFVFCTDSKVSPSEVSIVVNMNIINTIIIFTIIVFAIIIFTTKKSCVFQTLFVSLQHHKILKIRL